MLPLDRFAGFIEDHDLFTVSDKVLAAVSGGMDSVLLAYLLKAGGYDFSIAHCNFQLRGAESEGDQQFVAELAAQLGVNFHSTRFDAATEAETAGISLQMAARDLRYCWFEELRHRHGYQVVALGHHRNDAIETLLLNLVRGTGIAGLHGILPKNGSRVRPLLFLKREEIAEIIRQEGISYREDSSNSSVKYARNKLRLEVIPRLKELNPSVEEVFARNFDYFADLEMLLELRLEELRKLWLAGNGEEKEISIEALKQLRPQRLLLFGLLSEYGFNLSTVEQLIGSLDKHSGRRFESENWLLETDRGRLLLLPRRRAAPEPVDIKDGDHQALFGGYGMQLLHDDSPLIVSNNAMAAAVDAELLVYPLMLRTWRKGDFFRPLGMKGRQKLSDFFIHRKIPLAHKERVPLLVNGNGDLIWVCGYRLDDRYKVRPDTKKVIIFELFRL